MTFPACLALLLVAGSAAAPSTPLSFALTPQGAIIVPVTVNGSEPLSFLLDTGSNGSVISEQLASALNIEVVARTTLMSASGQREAKVARIEHLTLGPLSANGVLATIVPAADLRLPDVLASGHLVQGVIGQDVLGGLRFTIDYRAHQIVWGEAGSAAPRHATAFELEPRDDRFLVRLPQADRELRLVPDSGADVLVLFDDAARVPQADAVRPSVGITSLVGTRAARTSVVRRLRIGAATLTNVPAVIARRENAAASIDGLLPLHLFARVTFDGPARQLFIEPW